MIDTISFLNSQWVFPAVLLASLLIVVFILKEWFQSKLKRFYIKLPIVFLGILALSMIALRPAIAVEKDTSEMVILTPGYKENRLDSLKANYSDLKVNEYSVGDAIFDSNNAPTSVFILGQGIAPFDLWQLDSIQSFYLNSEKPTGIIRLKYDQNQEVGNEISIRGLYSNPKKGHKLILDDPSQRSLDSIVFTSGDDSVFKLSSNLNVTGTYVYSIVEKDSLNNLVSSDPIPVKIKARKVLKIAIINSFPTFETKYLKNYLAAYGHHLVVRSQLTKGKFKYEYFNTENKLPIAITPKSLKNFDLIITDANSLLRLSKTQQTNLENAIKQDGLGLVIQPNSRLFSTKRNLVPFQFKREKKSEVTFQNVKNVKVSVYPYVFKRDYKIHPIHETTSIIYSAYELMGQGRIGTTVYNNTYQLILRGKKEIYQRLWSDIIASVSRKNDVDIDWSSSSIFGYQDQPFEFMVRTNHKNPSVLKEEYHIPIKQDIDLSNNWNGRIYPRTTGWQRLAMKQDSAKVFDYYITDTTKWNALQDYTTIKANRAYPNDTKSVTKKQTMLQPLNPVIFFLVFICCFGFLWLEPKI